MKVTAYRIGGPTNYVTGIVTPDGILERLTKFHNIQLTGAGKIEFTTEDSIVKYDGGTGKKPRSQGDHIDMVAKNVTDLINRVDDRVGCKGLGDRSYVIDAFVERIIKEIGSKRYVCEKDMSDDFVRQIWADERVFKMVIKNINFQ